MRNKINFISHYDCFNPKNYTNNSVKCVAMSILFIILGNFLPKLRQNSYVGIRLPWTLKNETV